MTQNMNRAIFIACLLILQCSSAVGTTRLRSSGTKKQPTLQDVLTKLQELESTTIPSLLENIAHLEEKVSELEDRRRLADSCGFVLSADRSTCQLDVPVAFLSDVTVQGNHSKTKILGDLTVEGDTQFEGGSTRILSGQVNLTGAARIQDLIVGNSMEVIGASIFDSNIEVKQDAIIDNALTTKGHADVFDLDVDDELHVYGSTSFEDDVSIFGKDSEFQVDGDVTFDGDLTVEGQTDLQDVTEEGQLVFNNKVVFNNDVDMNHLLVQDLTINGACDGCV